MKNTAKLMKEREWASREFTKGSMPQNRTISTWILKGKIRGAVISGTVQVYEDQYFGVPQVVSNAVMHLVAESV